MSVNEKNSFDDEFIRLYDENFCFIVNYLLSIVDDFSSAEDIAHDVFLKLYRNKKMPPSGSSASRGYMIVSAKNMAIDFLRKQKKEEIKSSKCIPEWDGIVDRSFDVESIIIEGSIVSTVNDVLQEFPVRNRKIFIESVIERRKFNDMTSKEGLSRYKVHKISNDIVKTLRERLREYIE